MDHATEPGRPAPRPRPASAAQGRLACAYLHCLTLGGLQALPAVLDDIAAAGFSHVVFSPCFAGGSVFLAQDFSALHPALQWTGSAEDGLSFITESCRAAGLTWLLDVVLDKVAAHGAAASRAGSAFAATRDDVVDPYSGAAVARFSGDSAALAAFWAPLLRGWRRAGAAGFRMLGLEALPQEAIAAITQPVKSQGGAPLLLAWTADLPAQSVLKLRGCGFDRTCITLNNWDFAADWFWDRVDLFRQVAPVLVAAEAPFGPRLAAGIPDSALLPAALSRAALTAASLGSGWLMPVGFDRGTTVRLNERHGAPEDVAGQSLIPQAIERANGWASGASGVRSVAAPGLNATAFSVGSGDKACLAIVNRLLGDSVTVTPDRAVAALGGEPAEPITIAPGDIAFVPIRPTRLIRHGTRPRADAALDVASRGRIALERIEPAVDAGRFAAKRNVGDMVQVEADIICDGHDKLAAIVQWRAQDEEDWREAPMSPAGNDRWRGSFRAERVGRYLFRVLAWRDAFATFRDELAKKAAAGIDVRLEVIEGGALVDAAARRAPSLKAVSDRLQQAERRDQVTLLLSPETQAAMAAADDRPFLTTSEPFPVDSDRVAARFASWYEIFPRSMSDDETRHGTFRDVIRHLPRIRDMGFDVLYFPPIHPIGRTNRKGRNNALKAAPDDPGSPYGIGSEEGGHDAIHPELGTLEDFRALRTAAAEHELEIALDFAIQASPDHPWLREHKGWFAWRPDGSIRYAENPPKKYEDIVNVDFYAGDAVPGLWVALCEVVLFWVQQGVRTFRVDNPHTKPFPFWEWLIGEVRSSFPDTLFLAEAFTRPKVMNRLGKVGFSQSYTYFTWRNTKRELQDYLIELDTTEARDFFRPNFFVNTPDINPPFLQTSGRPGFLIRAALACTLSGLWGVYCGFELCEGTPVPGKEEYLDSEKYQIRAWDWDAPGNIVPEITRLNRIRRRNPGLQSHLGIRFLPADNDQVLFYEKATPERDNVVLVAVSLDPFNAQSAAVELPLWRWGLPDQASLACEDLLNDNSFTLRGKYHRVALNPAAPYTIWRARPAF
jgi:starch synthase (maltosyl-transferring)